MRIGFMLLAVFFIACNNEKQTDTKSEDGFRFEAFSEGFKETSLPYQLTDTALLQNDDTATIKNLPAADLIQDSVLAKAFGSKAKVRYTPLVKVEGSKDASYFIVKATANRQKAAFLLVFDKKKQFAASFPFLIPDKDNATFQSSSLDKNLAVTRNVSRKQPNDVTAEGKDVYVFSPGEKQFSLVMTDLLDERSAELINPIDTFSRTHKLAGDYTRGKSNIVSIRDGRKEGSLLVFVHIEKDGGDCSGELKGDATFTSPTTAVYRQPGDPCVLEFKFSGSSVKLTEVEGCGSRRGLDCSFEGSYTRKKEPKKKAEEASKQKGRK